MIDKKKQRNLLRTMAIISIGSLPFLLRKPPIKDWLFVFFLDGLSNGFIDQILVQKNYLKYPIRTLPKFFKHHIVFDYLIYPIFTIIYNQITIKDNRFIAFLKLFIIIIPLTAIEFIAERKTNLIKWGRKWTVYHTFVWVMFKSSFTRIIIAVVRKISERQHRKMSEGKQ
ncbi:CBO0543 family protein [Salipaludibacillus sp. HK11]|uniref:CBO0543 family protein n=1 Tax=Salipaludibacillus sp. HK11 TaxID=3394320 RepID=UPI0039FBFBEF